VELSFGRYSNRVLPECKSVATPTYLVVQCTNKQTNATERSPVCDANILTAIVTCHGTADEVHLKIVLQLVENLPAYYGTVKFITVFAATCHWQSS
jgi:hypothetical protein